MNKKLVVSSLCALALGGFSRGAAAHVSVVSGPAAANATSEIVFGVGHGCSGADTYKVRVQIPAGVTSVRAVDSELGRAAVEKDTAGLVNAVTWTKPDAAVLAEDVNYYKVILRLKTPDRPFTTLRFPTTQVCKSAAGVLTTVEWIAAGATGDAGAEADEPAPALPLVPAHAPGWNKHTVTEPVSDLAAFFKDAQIVWAGAAAYSSNPTTAGLIKTEPGTQTLTAIQPGTEIWVRY